MSYWPNDRARDGSLPLACAELIPCASGSSPEKLIVFV
jgi:hypothetical protein